MNLSKSGNYQTPDRMAKKLRAIPLPDLEYKRVLDVGTDFGLWAYLACEKGAEEVLGLDRNREINGTRVDLITNNRGQAQQLGLDNCYFERIDLGREWYEFAKAEKFDVIFCFSMYHHAFQSAQGRHLPIWYWLRRHISDMGGELLWEGPTDITDSVVRKDVSPEYHDLYTKERILAAAGNYFSVEYIGPAVHVSTRSVYRLRPLPLNRLSYQCILRSGTGNASKVFEFDNYRRIREIERTLGVQCTPGSLNLIANKDFHWGQRYYSAPILDVARTWTWQTAVWFPRIAHFYPLQIRGFENIPVYAFRFSEDSYPSNFVELISPVHLRNVLGNRTTIEVISC